MSGVTGFGLNLRRRAGVWRPLGDLKYLGRLFPDLVRLEGSPSDLLPLLAHYPARSPFIATDEFRANLRFRVSGLARAKSRVG